MRMVTTFCVAAFMVTHPVIAQQQKGIQVMMSMPPAKYDVPYKGMLTIWLIRPEPFQPSPLLGFCPEAKFTAIAIACAMPGDGWCDIYLHEKVALKEGLTIGSIKFELAIQLRHELGHCNGWGQDHAGGRRISVDEVVEMPELPPGSMLLRPYPSEVVCFTPNRIIEPCEARKN
jgi:hypothetical protein